MKFSLLYYYGISLSSSCLTNGSPLKDVRISINFEANVPLEHCEENAVVASWCDERVNPQVECALLKEFDQYGCSCYDNHAACPTECIRGVKPREITRSRIYCPGIPEDTPNYILKEGGVIHHHKKVHCEENAIISSWCDEFIDPNLRCSFKPNKNEYACNCHGNAASCPMDCVGGTVPYKRNKFSTHCVGIPMDQPNYVIQPQNILFHAFFSNSSNINN